MMGGFWLATAYSERLAAQFGKLSDALMANNAQRLEEMARQMLRPLLKSWLDDNLPQIVQATVDREVERIARGQVR